MATKVPQRFLDAAAKLREAGKFRKPGATPKKPEPKPESK